MSDQQFRSTLDSNLTPLILDYNKAKIAKMNLNWELIWQMMLLGLLIVVVLFTFYFYYRIFDGFWNYSKNP